MINLSRNLDKILIDLINIPSVTGNEERICNEVEKSMQHYGFSQEYRNGNNLVFHYGSKRGYTLGLVGHLDTVPLADKQKTSVKGDLIYGRGAVDMKAGLACMLKAAYEISKGNVSPNHSLSFVFYSGEEGPLPNGITNLLRKRALEQIGFAFVLEPTKGEYHIGCLGSLAGEITIEGVEAHSAMPWLGKNAIYEAQKIIRRVEKFGIRKRNVNGYVVQETMNITTANTQNARNVVPPIFVLNVNYRFAPGKSIAEAKREVLQIVRHPVKFVDESPSCLLTESPRTLKEGIPKKIIQGWTDIAQLQQNGISAVNFGPGDLEVAHKRDERISIKQLNEFYKSLISHL